MAEPEIDVGDITLKLIDLLLKRGAIVGGERGLQAGAVKMFIDNAHRFHEDADITQAFQGLADALKQENYASVMGFYQTLFLKTETLQRKENGLDL